MVPPDERDSEQPGLRERLWRVETRQADVLARLDKIDARIDGITQRQTQRRWSMEEIERKLEHLEQQASNGGPKRNGGRFVDSETMRAFIWGLLALVFALATGQAFKIGGFGG